MSLRERIFSLETEYAVNFYADEEDKGPDSELIVNALHEHMAGDFGMKESLFYVNGAKFHHDRGHAEWSLPECLSAEEAAVYDKAADDMLGKAVLQAEQNLTEKGFSGRLLAAKNNVDSRGNTYGCHENYMMLKNSEFLGGEPFLRYFAHCLVPFLVTRQLFAGAGRLIPPDDFQDGGRPLFELSQRARFIDHVVSTETIGNRAIINLGRENEPLAGDQFRRVHLILGDANLSGWATWMKLGTTGILLRMIEDLFFHDIPALNNPVQAVSDIAEDMTCRRPVLLREQRTMRAVDIQWYYFKRAIDYLDRFGATDDEQAIMSGWEQALKDLEKDPMLLRDRADWAVKRQVMTSFLEKHGDSWNDPLSDHTVKIGLQALELRYHDLSENGLFRKIMDPDPLVSEEAIIRARNNPPPYTRAAVRGIALSQAREKKIDATIDMWSEVIWQGKKKNINDPFEFDAPWLPDDPAGSVAALTHPYPAVRKKAAAFLSRKKKPDLLNLLKARAEKDDDPQVRRHIVLSLVSFGHDRAKDVLISFLGDHDPLVRWAAQEALERFDFEQPGKAMSSEPETARSDPIKIVGQFKAKGSVICGAVTDDGRLIAAGDSKRRVYFFDSSGRVVQEDQTRGIPYRMVSAEKTRHILTGCRYGNHAYLWNRQGERVAVFTTEGHTWGVGITPHADLVAVGSFDGHLYLFDGAGKRLWKRRVADKIRKLHMAASGKYIVSGVSDGSVYCFNQQGEEVWKSKTGGSIWAGAVLSKDDDFVVAAGSKDHHVYFFDARGKVKWAYNTGGIVNAIDMTPDGRFIAASRGSDLFLLNHAGELIEFYQTDGDVYSVALSENGRFLSVASYDHHVYFIDNYKYRMSASSFKGKVYGTAVTKTGGHFAAFSEDGWVKLFENSLLSTEGVSNGDANDHWQAQTRIRRFRKLYALNPHRGRACLLDEFDRALKQNKPAVCRIMMDDMLKEDGVFNQKEQRYIAGRRAALLLSEGINAHDQKDYQRAASRYQAARDLYHRLKYREGEGRTMAALQAVEKDEKNNTVDSDLLNFLSRDIKVIGDEETITADRVAAGSFSDQVDLIHAAKACGLLLPLLKGLTVKDHYINGLAAAAAACLDPGPDMDVLIKMLNASSGFVVWRALEMVCLKMKEDAETYGRYKGEIDPVIKDLINRYEFDPFVRRQIALLLKLDGSENTGGPLTVLLDDPDPDVRLAAVEGLLGLRDASTVEALQKTAGGKAFRGEEVGKQAAYAASSIMGLPE